MLTSNEAGLTGAAPCAGRPASDARVAAPGNVVSLMSNGHGAGGTPEVAALSDPFTKALLASSPDLIFQVTKDGQVTDFFAPADNECGVTPEQVVGHRVMQLLPTQLGQLAMHYLEKGLRTGAPQVFSCQYLLAGRLRHFETRLASSGGGRAVACVRDVTDRESLEREVVESSNRVQMRIGQDIHDGLGQHLTGITFLCRALEKSLAAKELPETAEAAEISKLVLEALAQTRNLARGLFPVEVESSNLVQTLQELASTVEQLFNISCNVECEESLIITHQDTSNHLFRLAQEAINNAVKHGKARRVIIGLKAEDGMTVFSVTDDGVGLPAGGPERTGLGTRIMTYRAQKIGGRLEIRRGEHGGVVVTCAFRHKGDGG